MRLTPEEVANIEKLSEEASNEMKKKLDAMTPEEKKEWKAKLKKDMTKIKRNNNFGDTEELAKCRSFGKKLYKAYKKEEKKECGSLFLKWMKDCFYALVVKDHIPLFDEIWNYLNEHKITFDKKLRFCDEDHHLWIEYPQKNYDFDQERQVIVYKNVDLCADDNTFIFIKEKSYGNKFNFRIVTVWDKEVKEKFNFKDDRDIKLPSIKTYRERNFDFGYGDGRDPGNIIVYENDKQMCKDSAWNENRIKYALDILHECIFAIKEEE